MSVYELLRDRWERGANAVVDARATRDDAREPEWPRSVRNHRVTTAACSRAAR